MAIGDIVEVPLKIDNHRINLVAGLTSVDYNVRYNLEFDKNEWELRAVAIGITATQTYTPSPLQPGIVRLSNSGILVSINPNAEYGIIDSPIGWNVFDASQEKSVADVKGVQIVVDGVAPDKVAVDIDHTYSIPIVAVSDQHCSVRQEISIVAEQLVDSPRTSPKWGKTEISGQGSPDPSAWFKENLTLIGIVGAIFVAGIFAAGFAGREFRSERAFFGEVSRDIRGAVKSRKSS